MLLQLNVRNVVLIEKLSLELSPGFNVLTGETGAGKSMIVDALSLVLGGRARPDMVRAGTKEAEVEALFDIEPGSRAAAKLEAAGVPCDRELVVRRVVQAEGRSRAFLNGRLCTAAQLGDLAAELCDIASQHESVSLTDASSHIEYLDAFGRIEAERHVLGTLVDELLGAQRALQAASEAERGRLEREDFLEFQLREFDELDPREGEDVTLEQERARLRHAEKLRTATRNAADRLYDGEDAVCDALGRVGADLAAAAAIDGSLMDAARSVEDARSALVDAARTLGRYADGVESQPGRLEEIEERLFRMQKLLRKYGPTVEDLLRHRSELREEREQLGRGHERIAELTETHRRLLGQSATVARELSSKRRQAAARLADAIGRELGALGMGRARVVVDVAPRPPTGTDGLSVEGAHLSRTGIDRVEFLISPNKGEEPRPLRRIASGGELSRALLALKRVLAEKGPAGLYVFDEVDAGVSGAIAEVIGRSIADIGRHRQVLCITHLPQIAALADTQFIVGKEENHGRTTTFVRRLGERERIDEIARMIGGVKVGDAARKAAAELLSGRHARGSA
jgi:DNA repair protein RecN (Recombination protein N)